MLAESGVVMMGQIRTSHLNLDGQNFIRTSQDGCRAVLPGVSQGIFRSKFRGISQLLLLMDLTRVGTGWGFVTLGPGPLEVIDKSVGSLLFLAILCQENNIMRLVACVIG